MMLGLKRTRLRGEKGFNLIELLVVIVIIGILAAIVIAIFPVQRQRAQDSAAKSLIRDAMTAVQSAYVDADTFDPAAAGMLPADLSAIEPSITFLVHDAAATAPTAEASAHAVNYTGTASTYCIGAWSESGSTFGVAVDQSAGTTYYVAGEPDDW